MWFVLSAVAQPLLPEPYRLGDDPDMLQPALADFDGDGLPEIVALDLEEVLLWSGRDPMVTSVIPGAAPSAIVADFTGDGVADVLAQDGLHEYGPDWPVVATYATWLMGFPADLDGDGDLDVVPGIGATWYENLGGGLAMASVPQIGVPADASCRPVDVDLDGSVDLACVEWSGQTLSWYQNDGTGFGFTPFVAYTNAGAWSLLPAPPTDVDADGDLDLVFTELFTVGNFVHGRLLLAAGDPGVTSLFGAAVDLADPEPTTVAPVVGAFSGVGWVARGGEVLPLLAGALSVAVPTVGSFEVQWVDWDGDGVTDELLSSGSSYAVVFDGFATGLVTADVLAVTLVNPILAVVDLDGDGDDDLSVGDAFLTRTDAWGRAFGIELTGYDVRPDWGDFDQDGLLDTLSGSTLIERDADGTWSSSSLFTLTGSPIVLSTRYGDLDGDGDPDVATFQDDGIAVWLDAGGSWTRVEVDLDHPHAGALGDLDGDGDLDLVAPTATGERWYENRDGTGTLWVERVLTNDFCGVDYFTAVDIVDLDGDGDNDVWMSGCDRFYERTAVGFTKVVVDLSDACVVGDVDLDGDLDLVTVGDNFVGTVWLERLSSAIADLVPHPVDDTNAAYVALLDLEGDGDEDLAVSTLDGIELFRNSTLTPPDDPDSDGVPDLEDGCPLDWDPFQDDVDGDGATDGCDCAVADPLRYPGAPEICQALDDDCDGATDEDFDLDLDDVPTCGADGVFGTVDDDCADEDPAIAPGLPEVPYNGVDDDCTPETLDDDLDEDGYGIVTDCDDLDREVNPGLAEMPYDGRDNDCDSATPDDDLDGDGFGIVVDCDDADAGVNPGVLEVPYDEIDQDCDAATPDDDLDGDGFDLAADCDDDDRFVNPARPEIVYDGIDQDCDPATLDDDLDGDGAPLAQDCDDADSARSALLTEIAYDGIDNDCNPATLDDDLDGDGAPLAQDCDDTDPARSGPPEITYDGIDNDCDPATLDDDLDRDGAPLAQDCDDADPARSGLATEIAYDGVDNDCNPATADDDVDGDGFGLASDCDDGDPAIGQPPCTPAQGAGTGCGCQEGGAAPGAWLVPLIALLVRRRQA